MMYHEKPEMVSPPAYLHPAGQTAVIVQPDANQSDEYLDGDAEAAPVEEQRDLKSDNLW
jgi:hypothetical protein